MLRKLIFSLVAALVLAGCGEGPTVPALEDPDGDPIELDESGGKAVRS